MYLSGKDRIEAEDFGAERAAKSREPGAERERDAKHRADIDAESARHALIVNRGAQAAAEPRLGEHQLQCDRQRAAYHDDEQTIFAHPDAEHVEFALQHVRDLHELLRGAHDVIGGRHRHEYEPDGEQDLIEMAPGIDVNV